MKFRRFSEKAKYSVRRFSGILLGVVSGWLCVFLSHCSTSPAAYLTAEYYLPDCSLFVSLQCIISQTSACLISSTAVCSICESMQCIPWLQHVSLQVPTVCVLVSSVLRLLVYTGMCDMEELDTLPCSILKSTHEGGNSQIIRVDNNH